MQTGDDVVLAALEKVKEWAMEKMLAPKEEGEPEQEAEAPPMDEPTPEGDDLELDAEPAPEMDEDDEAKPTVIGRYDFLGAPLKKKTNKAPVPRR